MFYLNSIPPIFGIAVSFQIKRHWKNIPVIILLYMTLKVI